MTDLDSGIDPEAARAVDTGFGRTPRTPRRKRKEQRVKKAIIWVHRWSSFTIGLLLVLVCTTGALVLYTGEWKQWTNGKVYENTTSDHPVTIDQALATVQEAHPDFQAGYVNWYSGIYEVYSNDYEGHHGFYGVDEGSGRITGYANPDAGFMALMNQIHECFFTCDSYPGYAPWLAKNVPTLGMSWLTEVTWGGLILGVTGILLIFLAISGIWLWWPSFKRWTEGFRVRFGKGRYARDYDLHQVVGMVAIPFLLMWGLTGAALEFQWVRTAWYAATFSPNPDDHEVEFLSEELPADGTTPDISPAEAVTAARAGGGGDTKVVWISTPTEDDPTSAYYVYFAKGFDQYRDGPYPGAYSVGVDRHDAARTQELDYSLAGSSSWAETALDRAGVPTAHFGFSVNGWWRTIWFVFGLTPLFLMITGISTWLAKRGVRKRRTQATAAREAAARDAAARATAPA
jgi:uncharacterized iron-regulated membrane protein